jgi:zinc protease
MSFASYYKKIPFFLFFLCFFSLRAQCVDIPPYYHRFQLDNGLEVVVLENLSDALVHVELAVRAGYSAQTRETAGFFPLYTRLFFSSARVDAAFAAECLADSARYRFTVPPAMLQSSLEALGTCAIRPDFSRTALESEFSRLKSETAERAASVSSFINAAIDARMFPEAPWQYESGIDSAAFRATSVATARAILSVIQRTRYTPDNAALFISGPITAPEAETLVSRIFGGWDKKNSDDSDPVAYRPSNANPLSPLPQTVYSGKRFVLVSDGFSRDFNQIVIQYAAREFAFSESNSVLQSLLTQTASYILSDSISGDYIGFSAAHQQGNSRVSIPALLDPAADPALQAAQLSSMLRSVPFPDEAAENARRVILAQYAAAFDTPANLSDALQAYWESESEQFFSAPELANRITSDTVRQFLAEEPYIFLLIRPETYAKYERELSAEHFEPVTPKTASWYTQSAYRDAQTPAEVTMASLPGNPAVRYYRDTNDRFTSVTLQNGIPLVFKDSRENASVTIALEIAGGERRSPIPGLETLLLSALAENIRQRIKQDAQFFGPVAVSPEITADYGVVFIECKPEDVRRCIAAAGNALTFGTITPAMADVIVYNMRPNSPDSDAQLYTAAMQTLYGDTPDEHLYRNSGDIGFAAISAAYPDLLDASRCRLLFAGNLSSSGDIVQTAEQYFGALKNIGMRKLPENPVMPHFTTAEKVVALRRVFVAAATPGGGMPAVLVPTADFSDPAHFFFPSVSDHKTQVLVNAILFEIEAAINGGGYRGIKGVSVVPASERSPWYSIRFSGVTEKARLPAILNTVVSVLLSQLNGKDAAVLCQSIKNRWALKTLSDTGANTGTIRLMLDGIYNTGTAAQFLEDYVNIENADTSNFISALQAFQNEDVRLAVYSADTK